MVLNVIFDSNFLMDAPRFRVDALREIESHLGRNVRPILLSPVLEELENIARCQKPKDVKAAKLAMQIARSFVFEDVERKPGESVDDVIFKVAKERGWIVATNDKRLRLRLKNNSVPVIYLRQRFRLEFQGVV
jgi:rRNA-processing protein FCF1